jgi:uncharacterized lipoprotein YmbA
MMLKKTSAVCLIVSSVLLSACASSPSANIFTLVNQIDSGLSLPPTLDAPILFELNSVSVNEQLARPQIVLRAAGNQLEVLEQSRWSAPFQYELRDALATDIVRHSGAIDITKSGRPSNAITWRVAVDLKQYDAVAGKGVNTLFNWSIVSSDGKKNLFCQAKLDQVVNQSGVEGVVMSTAIVVNRLSGKIAEQLVSFNRGGNPVCSAI